MATDENKRRSIRKGFTENITLAFHKKKFQNFGSIFFVILFPGLFNHPLTAA
jgi:hypothetical protein